MPWLKRSEINQRWDLIQQIRAPNACVAKVCRQWKVSRKTAYKWLTRYRRKGIRGLQNEPPVAQSSPHKYGKKWRQRARQIRVRNRWWGVRKLRHQLQAKYGKRGLPSVTTMGRWLKEWKLTRARRKRSAAGPIVKRKALPKAVTTNDVWTADFKGWFRLKNGERVEPLTVRDLVSRYVLLVEPMSQQNVARTFPAFRHLFVRYGMPKAIRVDNGSPFGSKGPAGLTRLSAWWTKLGIEVDFIRPGHPEDNAGHEHFHGVLKREITNSAAKTWRGQQRRTQKWLKRYNAVRPHEGLGMKSPEQLYRSSPRKMLKENRRLSYAPGWQTRMVNRNGLINWGGQLRFVGEAFVGERVGLKKGRSREWQVHFANHLIGVLGEGKGGIRPARHQRSRGRN